MELTEKQYRRIAGLLPVQRGNVKIENRILLNALIYRCENGCTWRALPERFGNWHTVYMRHLVQVFEDVRALKRPVVVHVLTRKGKGDDRAENDPGAFHGVEGTVVSPGIAAGGAAVAVPDTRAASFPVRLPKLLQKPPPLPRGGTGASSR
jgi:transposase